MTSNNMTSNNKTSNKKTSKQATSKEKKGGNCKEEKNINGANTSGDMSGDTSSDTSVDTSGNSSFSSFSEPKKGPTNTLGSEGKINKNKSKRDGR